MRKIVFPIIGVLLLLCVAFLLSRCTATPKPDIQITDNTETSIPTNPATEMLPETNRPTMFTDWPLLTATPLPSTNPTPTVTEPSPTLVLTPAPTLQPTSTPTVTPAPTPTPVLTTPTPTPAPTPMPTSTPKPTITPAPTPKPNQYPIQYSDSSCTITITKEWYGRAWCYIAHLQFTDYSRFYSECANGRYNHGYETTSHCANRLGALLCVNGDYSAPNLNYAVVRKGHVWNNRPYYAPGSYNAYNGKFFWTYEGSPTSGQMLSTLVANHQVSDSFTFGPPFLLNGNISASQGGGRRPRTFMGTNGQPGDIWIVVADGDNNDGQSSGLTGYECAKLLKDKGCTFGIPLDGGGSSTMVWKGKVINAVKGHERAVVDFVVFK